MESATDQPFGQVARQMSRMLEQMSRRYSNYYPPETWTPNVNLYETDDTYMVCVDLAGVNKSEIELTVAEGRLVLRGARAVPTCPTKEDAPAPKAKMHLMEIDHGAFSREVELPTDIQQDKINATYVNGLLWIEIPRS